MNHTKTYPLFASVFAGAMLLASCGGAPEAKTEEKTDTAEKTTEKQAEEATYKVNTDQSTVKWKGDMVGMYSHEGTIKLSEGVVTVKGDQITGGSFTVDMTTMTPTDENYKPEEGQTPDKLVGHLSSPDFFDVETHPTASAKIISVDGNDLKVEMTIRGKSNSELLHIDEVNVAGGTLKSHGAITFDRQKYDVSFKHPMQEMVLSDEIELSIDLVANK